MWRKRTYMKTALVGFLVMALIGWIPCPCQGRCSTESTSNGGESPHACCQSGNSSHDDSSQETHKQECCCDQGLCGVDQAELPATQVIVVGSALISSAPVQDRIGLKIRDQRTGLDPIGYPILPNSDFGFLLPDLSFLLI